MVKNKRLFRETDILAVNDLILETNRFNSKQYTLYQVVKIDYSRDEMYIQRVVSSNPIDLKYAPQPLYSNMSAHALHKNTKWLTYILEPEHPLMLLYDKR